MAEFLVTCSLAMFLVALLFGACRIFVSRGTRRPDIHERHREFRLMPRSVPQVPSALDVPYYL